MSLENAYFASQIAAVLIIIVSLVFVGVQIKQNTATTRASAHHAVSDALIRINLSFAENAEITRIYLKGLENRSSLSTEDRWRFDAILRAYFHVCETMFFQANIGPVDDGIMSAEENGIRLIISSTGGAEWWQENIFGFDVPFREYVSSLINRH